MTPPVEFDKGTRVIRGYALVWGQPSILTTHHEVVVPEALDRTRRERRDVQALVNHEWRRRLAKLSNGSLRLRPDTTGLGVELIVPTDALGTEVTEALARGEATGWSFSFRPLTLLWDVAAAPITRTITDCTISEVSLLLGKTPAFKATAAHVELSRTPANLRLTDWMWHRPEPLQLDGAAVHVVRMAKPYYNVFGLGWDDYRERVAVLDVRKREPDTRYVRVEYPRHRLDYEAASRDVKTSWAWSWDVPPKARPQSPPQSPPSAVPARPALSVSAARVRLAQQATTWTR